MDGVVVAVVRVQEAGEGFLVHAGVAEGDVLGVAEVQAVAAEDRLIGGIVDLGDAGGVVVKPFEDLAGRRVGGAHERATVVGEGDVFVEAQAIGGGKGRGAVRSRRGGGGRERGGRQASQHISRKKLAAVATFDGLP